MDYQEFLKLLKKDEAKLGQVKTAKKYGITQASLSFILSGKRSGFQVWRKRYGTGAKK